MAARTYFEFFAGGGMARAGLGDVWSCAFANDIDPAKASAYKDNFGSEHLKIADIAALRPADLPAVAPDLIWASFPCQDLSLAGGREGLAGRRSGVFFEFWRLVLSLIDRRTRPRAIVLENVAGLLNSNGGDDLQLILEYLARAGYLISALVIDAARFTPQSRRRLFIFGFDARLRLMDVGPGGACERPQAADEFTPAVLLDVVDRLKPPARRAWRRLTPRPSIIRNTTLVDILEADQPFCENRARDLVARMAPLQRARLEEERNKAANAPRFAAAFNRIRMENGERRNRFEARFDGLAGCLRTPAGGSSRQFVLRLTPKEIGARLLSPRECARLMGLDDAYRLPSSATAAYKLTGDGVVVPVVRWISEEILAPVLSGRTIAA